MIFFNNMVAYLDSIFWLQIDENQINRLENCSHNVNVFLLLSFKDMLITCSYQTTCGVYANFWLKVAFLRKWSAEHQFG